MAYSEIQAERFRAAIDSTGAVVTKCMMGGLIFMLNGNMLGGVDRDPAGADRFMFRVGPERLAEALARPGSREVTMGGRRMNGFVFVADCSDADLADWVRLALAYVEVMPAK